MFALRGIAVSLTFFVLVYCLLSAVVAVSWRSLGWLRVTQQTLAASLFALRVLPLVGSIVVTLTFVVPSFQLLEPRSVDEGLGSTPFALGLCALMLIACGCYRVIVALNRTSYVVARWLEDALPLDANAAADADVVTFRARREAPPLTLVGVRKPKVLVSDTTVNLLSDDELRIALKHELAHMRSRDNLKKLVFRFCPFPGLSKLESAWSQTAELAADDAAVSTVDDAVDLAAALVKLSRLLSVEAAPVCTVGFVTGTITDRVARLLAWDDPGKKLLMKISAWYALPPTAVLLLCVFVTYGPVLTFTHQATEWLVR
jgi:Peptidase family M48